MLNLPSSKMSTTEKSRVRRCLFGAPDHESLKQDLKKSLDEDLAQMNRQWNFDFSQDRPLDGRFKWEVVPSDTIPAFYTKQYQSKKTVKIFRQEKDQSENGNICDNSDMDILARPLDFSSDEEISSSQQNSSNNTHHMNISTTSECNSGKILVQRQIGDFMKKRKRVGTLSSKAKLRRLEF